MLIKKEELPQVAMEFMNNTHDEDVDIINELYNLITSYEKAPIEANKILLDTKYQEWFEHTIEHFKTEEDKMIEMRFPPYPMHKGEHEKALQMMDELFRSWQSSRDITLLKDYFTKELSPWLINHIQTMDTITAQFFQTGMSPCSMH